LLQQHIPLLDLAGKINSMKRLLVSLAVLSILATSLQAKKYFFHAQIGNDENIGTSILAPFKSLAKIPLLKIGAGDTLLLAAGQVFKGTLHLKNIKGTREKPILITTYRVGPRGVLAAAEIDASGYANGIQLLNCSFIKVEELSIRANGGGLIDRESDQVKMRCGVLVQITEEGEYEHISLRRLCIADIFYEEKGFERGKKEVRTANGTQKYGWGIRVINRTKHAKLREVLIRECQVENVAHTGIKLTGGERNIESFLIEDCEIRVTGGPGMQMSGVNEGRVRHNYISHSGSTDDSRKWGRGSGLWTWGSRDVVIEHNQFLFANGPGDSAGCHIDFNCENIVVQYNLSANNAGGFCEILGNNYNCAYRYNISINDGHRVKGENGAFQEGKTFWLSGFAGRKKPRKGPFNSYFYNNTIVVDTNIVAKMAIDRAADGMLIMNNIFCIRGESAWVLGDQYKPDKGGAHQIKRVVFKNNLFLKDGNWPVDGWIQPEDKSFGSPQWETANLQDIFQWIPTDKPLIQGKGLPISKIPGDSIGLTIGLAVEYDILGQAILGTPSLGAIHIPEN